MKTPLNYLLVLVICCLGWMSYAAGQEVVNSSASPSLFQFLRSQDSIPSIVIDTDVKKLLRTSSKKKYQPVVMDFYGMDGSKIRLSGEIKARGFMRKKVCRIPPVKLNFEKQDLVDLGYSELDKLKLVFPCNNGKYNEAALYKEYLLYDLYSIIDTNSIQAALVNINLLNNGNAEFDFTGFLVEDEDNYAHRKNAIIIENALVASSILDRSAFVNMIFFQYMIGNTDWAIRNKHNIEMVKLASLEKVIALSYDYDYSGFVDQSYALPHESLPIKSVQERHFFNYKITDKEFIRAAHYIKSKEKAILGRCDAASYMSEVSIKECKKYLQSFFKKIEKPANLLKSFRQQYPEQ